MFKKNKEKYLNLFLIISSIGILIFFLVAVIAPKIEPYKWLVMEHNYNWQFSDFFRQIVYASDLRNIYFNTSDAPFPPLAYVFFHVIWRGNPISLPISLSSWKTLALDKNYLLIFFIILSIVLILLYVVIKNILQKYKGNKTLLFTFLILLSAPFFAGAIERGNPALFVLVLILFALYFKDHENKYLRELSLILIAIAAGFKIYPAIFGLLWVKEKRWKEVIRLIIYGIIFFFLPFIFAGGIKGLSQYLKVVGMFEGYNYARWTSIRCFLFAICNSLGITISSNVKLVGMILENAFLILSLICMFIEKKEWKRYLYLAGIMSVYVSNSYRYTSIYMFIPLVFFLKELYDSDNKKINYVYIILFALIYTIPIWVFKFEVDFGIFMPIYILLIVSFFDTIVSFIKSIRKKN